MLPIVKRWWINKLIDSEFTNDSYYQTFKASIINYIDFANSYDELDKINYINFPKFDYCNIDFSVIAIDEVWDETVNNQRF